MTSTGTSYYTSPREAPLARDEGLEAVPHRLEGDALLLQGVAVADRHLPVLDGVEIDGDAEGGAGLVLAAVAAADGARVVVEEAVIALEVVVELARYGRDRLLLREGEDGGLGWGDSRVELQDGAFLAVHLFFRVGVHQKGEHDPVGPDRGLY